jgi:hypothetical protein
LNFAMVCDCSCIKGFVSVNYSCGTAGVLQACTAAAAAATAAAAIAAG